MQFTPTDEQVQLKDSVRRYVEKTYAVARKKAVASGSGFVPEHWASFAELGWFMAGLPEDVGGLGGTAFDSAVVAEELGRGLVLEPFTPVAIMTGQVLAELAPTHDALAKMTVGEARPVRFHLRRLLPGRRRAP